MLKNIKFATPSSLFSFLKNLKKFKKNLKKNLKKI